MTSEERRKIATYMQTHPEKAEMCKVLLKFLGWDNERTSFFLTSHKKIEETERQAKHLNPCLVGFWIGKIGYKNPSLLYKMKSNDIQFEILDCVSGSNQIIDMNSVSNIKVEEYKDLDLDYDCTIEFTQEYGTRYDNPIAIDYSMRIMKKKQ